MTTTTSTVFCPQPSTYAVVELDVEATTRDLDDEAKRAAQAIKPAKCVVYLYLPLEIPFRSRSWNRYMAYIVGPTLRPEEPNMFITSDMCVPIFPNEAHPNGRAPIRPTKPFPWANCYHWAGAEVTLRVRNGKYPEDPKEVTALDGEEHFMMDDILTEDLLLGEEARKERNRRENHLHEAVEQPEIDERRGSKESIVPLAVMEPYDAAHEDLLPVVNVWLNLEDQFEEADVPDPVEFVKQKNALTRIVQDYHARTDPELEETGPKDVTSVYSASTCITSDVSLSTVSDEPTKKSSKLSLRRIAQKIKSWMCWG